MVVAIYREHGRLTFRGTEPILRVEVPEGSELLATAGIGLQLFAPVDRWTRRGFDPAELVRAARAGRRGFGVL